MIIGQIKFRKFDLDIAKRGKGDPKGSRHLFLEEIRTYKWVVFKDLKDYLLFDNQIEDTTKKLLELFFFEKNGPANKQIGEDIKRKTV